MAEGAFIAKLRGDLGQASLLTKQSFDLEQEAAALIAHQLDAEPTRSVLHRSAATLAIDCGEFKAAECLITTALCGKHKDGTVVEVLPDGSESPFPVEPMRHMSEEEIHAAAEGDPDARPMTEGELRNAKRVPRVKIIRRALQLTQEEFAARYHIPLGTEAGLGART